MFPAPSTQDLYVYIINNPYMIRTSAESRRQCHGQSLQRALAVCSACSGAGAGRGRGRGTEHPIQCSQTGGEQGKENQKKKEKRLYRLTLKEVHPVAEHMPRAPCLLQTPRRIATEVQSWYEQDPYAPCLMQRPSAADGVWQPSAVQI